MDIGEVIGDSIKYPSQNWKKVIILGILSIISFLIIPVFLVLGYFLRIIKATIAGSDELPEFDEWGDMLIEGLKVFIVELIYFIIPAIIIIIGTWASLGSLIAAQGAGIASSTAIFGLLGGFMLIGVIIAIVIGLIATIAIANMAYYDGELSAAFKFSEIMDHISQIGWVDYIIWYIVMILIAFVIGIISSILNALIIGIVLTPLIIAPFAQMFYARSLALLFTSKDY